MKTRFLIAALSYVFMLTSTQIFAQDGIGLGGELLSPTGISYKVPINESSAITGALGFLIAEFGSNAMITANYIYFLDNENINLESGKLSPYIGAGLWFQIIDDFDNQSGLQIPFGIEYEIDNAPIEVYMDIGPFVRFNDPVFLTLSSSLGFRYRF